MTPEAEFALAAVYARYSTDNQRQTSTEDQLRNGRAIGERERLGVTFEYSDDETSAFTPVALRPGGRQLMTDALAGRWQVLIIEGLDRFSRNLVDQERMVRRLEYAGIRIIGYTDGYDTRLEGREFMRQVRGSFNEERLREISKKTHRGLDGQITRGYHAGGISYGYRSVCAGVDGKGEPIGFRLEVDQVPADVVRWIFSAYADGWSCQRIAYDLNARAVPAPRGKTWAVSAIYGAPRKGSGILNNPVYAGEYIWNRSRWVKDPDTGKRSRLDRPREEWKITTRPDLVIVDPEAWRRVRARMDRTRLAGGSRGRGRPVRTLFGGLLACGHCGGAVVAVSQWTYGCSTRKDRGPTACPGVRVPRPLLDQRLLTALRDELLSPEAITTAQADFARLLATARKERDQLEARAHARVADLEREIANLVDAVAQSGFSKALQARLEAAEAARAAIRTPPPPPAATQLPAIQAAYKRLVADLSGSLTGDIPRARAMLQDALGGGRLVQEGTEVYAEMETRPERLLLAGGAILNVVAGTRFGTWKRIRIR